MTFLLVAPVWGLAYAYMTYAPKRYATEIFMILPGEGSRASVSLDQIGQASSQSSSPWSSNRLSPVESYRKLMMTETVHRRAATSRKMEPDSFPRPKIKLIDQTNFITIKMKGKTPEDAQANAQALLDAFYHELDSLRKNFTEGREAPNRAAISAYQKTVTEARRAILAFKARTGLASQDQFDEAIASVERTERRVLDIQSELQRRSGEVAALERTLGTGPSEAAMALKLRADPIFQALLEDTTANKVAFERVRTEFGERHPKYLEARRNYVAVSQAMIERGMVLTGRDEAGFRSIADIATLGTREVMMSTLVENAAARDGLYSQLATLQNQLLDARGEIQRLSGPAAELDQLEREHQVAQAVFASALARADTTKADQFGAYPLAQIVEVPVANADPVSPSKKVAILGAVGATVLILFGLMLVWLRGPILRGVGRAFSHPSVEITDAMAGKIKGAASPAITSQEIVRETLDELDRRSGREARRERERQHEASGAAQPKPTTTHSDPPALDNQSLDDEPLIEIPHQISYGYTIGGVMNVRLRSDNRSA